MDVIKGIVSFNEERKLDTFNAYAEYKMLEEELNEFLSAVSMEQEREMIDALCDVVVVAVGAMHKLGYNPTRALSQTVQEITSRQGSFDEETGKWQKDLEQDPLTLYKADYDKARR